MIKTASLENSKRLYELAPEWNDTHCTWKRLMTHETLKWKDWFLADWNNSVWDALGEQSIPAPDLDWLLDKLPQNVGRITLKHREHSGIWFCKWDNRIIEQGAEAETPSDAACKLLINLVEEGVVKV